MDTVLPEVDEQQSYSSSSSSSSSSSGVNKHEAGGSLPKAGIPNFVGKHRMAAAVSLLHQQINIIQEELEQLETLGESSIVCKELISSIESAPDALLPETKGPADVSWDRWFRGVHSSRTHKRWI